MIKDLNSIIGLSGVNEGHPHELWNQSNFRSLKTALRSAEKANAMLFTSSWQVILESVEADSEASKNNIREPPKESSKQSKTEKYIWCLGNGRYCLLIFDPKSKKDDPKYIDASRYLSEKSLRKGYENWRSKITDTTINDINQNVKITTSSHNIVVPDDNLKLRKNIFNRSVLDIIEPKVIENAISSINWPIIICTPPRKVYTSKHPIQPHKVGLIDNQEFISLAGIYTRDKNGVFGATICYHCLNDTKIEIGKTKVFVNGIEGTIISANKVTDSCFVQLDISDSEINSIEETLGPLIGVTPREFEKCSFINQKGSKVETYVTGWSPDLMFSDSYNQVKVLTKPATNVGDSGSALIDSKGNILGFSFYRTGLNSVVEFSAWIWAHSVFQAHNLSY